MQTSPESEDANSPQEVDWLERNLTSLMVGIVVAAIVVGMIVLLTYVYVFRDHAISANPFDWAPFGNYVGGILGTVLAFFVLAVLLLSLEVQRRELKATRDELEKSYGQAKRHNFENTFFKLLELHQLRVNALVINAPEFNLSALGINETSAGRSSVFIVLWSDYLLPLLTNKAFKDTGNQSRSYLLDFTENRFANIVESYYNNLMETFQIISSWHHKETAKRYFRILQAQMTADELRCLFVFVRSERYEEMKQIIEEFSFFRSKAMFEIPKAALRLYAAKAYGDLADTLLRTGD